MTFKAFAEKIRSSANTLLGLSCVFTTDTDKTELYQTYLNAFTPQENSLYNTRTEHDCTTCRHFIERFGNVVAVVDNKLFSIWDALFIAEPYNKVAKEMSNYVKSKPIVNVFLHNETIIGKNYSLLDLKDSGGLKTRVFHHFHVALPLRYAKNQEESNKIKGEMLAFKQVFERGLNELTAESFDVLLQLIAEDAIYRGQEFRSTVETFRQKQEHYHKVENKDIFVWKEVVSSSGALLALRNSAIGTFLVDISKGEDLDTALRSYESIMAPANYKRPKGVYSQVMRDNAKKKVEELGLTNSLARRFATIEDAEMHIRGLLFSNTDIIRKPSSTDPFDQLSKAAKPTTYNLDRVNTIPIEDFIANVLPKLTSMEVLFEPRHEANLMSVIAPMNRSAESLFKWSNGYSIAYKGNVADSMKQRVKNLGGNVEGVLRYTIQWNEGQDNPDDLDAHCLEPNLNHIFYQNKKIVHPSSGMLDVDIQNPGKEIAIENIAYKSLRTMPEGLYRFSTENYANRGGRNGFRAELEFGNQLFSYDYRDHLRFSQKIEVVTVKYDISKGFSIFSSLDCTEAKAYDVWNVSINKFSPVSCMMLSPNYWEEQVGNKHYLFVLDDCVNEERPNGFFNEFLRQDLHEHRQVFEALGAIMQVEPDGKKQLSGLGFSSTQRNLITLKIYGAFNSILKVAI